MTAPNLRVELAGHRLQHVIAKQVTQALDHLNRETRICDGWASKGESAGRSSDSTSVTESIALMREHLSGLTENIYDTIDMLEITIQALADKSEKASGIRAPLVVTRCRDNQHGRQGAIEWGRPGCEEIPVKAGCCSGCYQRERRWRLEHGLQARDIEEAA